MEVPGLWAFIGYDPGVTSGIAWGTYSQFAGTGYRPGNKIWSVTGASSDPEGSLQILRFVLRSFKDDFGGPPVLFQGEKFVTSRNPGTTGKAADLTREYLDYAVKIAENSGASCVRRPAADVKPWATDKRLEKIGFPLAPKLKDARDAGRHMLYGACKSGRAVDPLI